MQTDQTQFIERFIFLGYIRSTQTDQHWENAVVIVIRVQIDSDMKGN